MILPRSAKKDSGFGGVLSSDPLRPDRIGERPDVPRGALELRADITRASRNLERRVPARIIDRGTGDDPSVAEQTQGGAGAVADLDRDVPRACAVRIEIELRATRRLRHKGSTLA